MTALAVILLALSGVEGALAGGEAPLGSPDFRGPFGWRGDGSGRFLAATPALEWSPTKNVRWSVEIGSGYASPILTERLVVTASEPDRVTAVDRAEGKIAWTHAVKAEGPAAAYKPKDTGLAAATPVTDGTRIYAVFANGLVRALNLDGTAAWTAYVDAPQTTAYGRSASPILAGGKLIVHMTHLYAFDPANGKRLWVNEESRCAYGTPAALKDVVVTPAGDVVRVDDGKTVNSQLSNSAHASPAVVDGTIYFGEKDVRALRLDAAFKDASVWNAELAGEVFGSPLSHDGLLFAATDKGVLSVFEGGKPVVDARALFGDEAGADLVYSSFTLAGRHLFLQANDGRTLVLEATKEAKVVALNTLKDGSGSSPVFSGKDMFIRDGTKLVRVAE
jgi:outer membrane protein assembly factor BamB